MHRGTAVVAKELLAALAGEGGRAFDELEWARWSIPWGHEMNAGRSSEETHCLSLGDVRGLKNARVKSMMGLSLAAAHSRSAAT